MIWRSKHAATAAAAFLVLMAFFYAVGEVGLALACWIPAAALTLLFMNGSDEDEEGV